MVKEFKLAEAYVDLKTRGGDAMEKSLDRQREKVRALMKGMHTGEFARFTEQQERINKKWASLTGPKSFSEAFAKGGLVKGIASLAGNPLAQNMLGGALAGGAASGGSLGGMLGGAGAGAALAGGPWGMAIAAGIQGMQLIHQFGQKMMATGEMIFNKVLAYVQIGNPVVAERFNLAMQDLYGVIGFQLSPMINRVSEGVRYFADILVNSPAMPALRQFSEVAGQFVSTLIKSFADMMVNSGALMVFGMALRDATDALRIFSFMVSADAKTIGFLLNPGSALTGQGKGKTSIGMGGGGDVGYSDIVAAKERFQIEALKASAYGGGKDPQERTATATEQMASLMQGFAAVTGNPFLMASSTAARLSA